MKIVFILFCLIIGNLLYAQNITGIWRGVFYERTLKGKKNLKNEIDQKFNFEIQINQHTNNQLDGVTYSYKTKKFYGKASFKGSIDIRTKKILIEENNMLDLQIDNKSEICVMSCILEYNTEKDKIYLKGTFVSKNMNRKIECSSGDVILERVNKSEFKKEMFIVEKEGIKIKKKNLENFDTKNSKEIDSSIMLEKDISEIKQMFLDSLFKVDTASPKTNTLALPFLNNEKFNRPTIYLNTITVNVNKVLVDYYDNGIEDNDTITVYQNKILVINSGRVSNKPLQLKLVLDSSNSNQELVTIAENLGDIPPNTALMVITAGNNRYEIPISIDERRNAKVLFEYKKNAIPKMSLTRTQN